MYSEIILAATIQNEPETMDIVAKVAEQLLIDRFEESEVVPSLTYNLVHRPFLVEDDDESMDLSKYLGSDYFKTLSRTEKHLAVRALGFDNTEHWTFGLPLGVTEADNPQQGELFAVAAPERGTHRASAGTLSRFVLSGMVGAELITVYPFLREYAQRHQASPLNQAIYAGGVVIGGLRQQQANETRSYATYHSQSTQDETAYITGVGADQHGDFRTYREAVPLHYATDPLSRRWPFVESEPSSVIASYHSCEPEVLYGLLQYKLAYEQQSPGEVYNALQEKLTGRTAVAGSGGDFFADYDSSNTEFWYQRIQDELQEGIESLGNGEVLSGPFMVHPGENPLRMVMKAQKDGVLFENYSKSEQLSHFVLPSGELDDYIVTLLSESYGRTNPEALRLMLKALQKDSV